MLSRLIPSFPSILAQRRHFFHSISFVKNLKEETDKRITFLSLDSEKKQDV